MSLTKWFRKNNKKVFGVVTVIILFGFIGGGALMRNSQNNRVMAEATYGNGQKITNLDVHNARQELEVMAFLGGVNLLQMPQSGLGGVFLSELLFTEGRPNPNVTLYLSRLVSAGQLNLTEEELVSFYDRNWPPAYYWILLRQEAQQAGISISNDTVKSLLGRLIPSMTQNQGTYGTAMTEAVRRYNMPEAKILTTYGQMLAVLEYAQTINTMQNATSTELEQVASQNEESINAEWVEFDSTLFAKLLDPNDTADADQIQAQFEQFKDVAPGLVSQANPFGFGYKLPDRVQFDYMIIDLDAVQANLNDRKPTQEDAERFYKNNASTLFTVPEPLDPNDPDAGSRDRIQPFSEVAQQIYDQLTDEATIAKAEQILQEARSEAESPLMKLGSSEERDLEKVIEEAPQFGVLAQQLSEKYGITLVSGRTGWLSRSDLDEDELSALVAYDRGNQGMTQGVALDQLLFMAEPIGTKSLSLMTVQPPYLYDTIGPLKRPSLHQNRQVDRGEIMALVRLVDARSAEAPTSVNQTYDNSRSSLRPSVTPTQFSVREQVVSDLQSQAAFALTQTKAQELSQMVTDQGWDAGIAQFNQTYGERIKPATKADPNVMKLSEESSLKRTPLDRLTFLQQQAQTNASLRSSYRTIAARTLFADKLYDLLAETTERSLDTQAVIASEGQGKVYVVKHLDLIPLSLERHMRTRGALSTQLDMQQVQRLTVLHLIPKNIESRWDLQSTRDDETEETQEASDTE